MNEMEFNSLKNSEDNHFWFQHKRRLLKHYIQQYLKDDSLKIFDSGCGTCRDIYDFKDSIGMDINFNGLILSDENCNLKVNGNVNEIPVKNEMFDIILSMDVLQHKGVDVKKAIKEYGRILKRNGILIMNLPSINFLYSYHDLSVDNDHRYSRLEIKRMLGEIFNIDKMVFWNGILFLPIALSRILISHLITYKKKSDVYPMSKAMNSIGNFLLKIESVMTYSNIMPVGFSLLTIARKKEKR